MKNELTATQKTLSALGLCAKARGLIVGTPMICEALKNRKKEVFSVLCASDNSNNTAKRLADRCAYYGVRLEALDADGDMLGKAVGKSGRVAAVAVTDENLWRMVEKALRKDNAQS